MNTLEGKKGVRRRKVWVWLIDGGSKISDRFGMMVRMVAPVRDISNIIGCGQKGKVL